MLLFGCEWIFHKMLQNLSTLLIWTFYWQEFDRQEWAVKRFETRWFTLREWSARRNNICWWRFFKGPLHRNGVLPTKTIIFLRWQLPNNGTMVTVREELYPASKRSSSDMKGKPVRHYIMPSNTMHKTDFCAEIWSPKLLISSGNLLRWWNIYIIGFVLSDLVLEVLKNGQGQRARILWQLS